MTSGSILSGIFHIALALLVVFGLPSFLKEPPEPELPATVEVVTLAPKATAPELTKPPAPKQPDPPKQEVKPDPTPPTPPKAAEPAKPEPTPPTPPKVAEQPKPEPIPEKAEPIKAKEEPKKEEPKKEPPKPVQAKKPEEPKKPEKDRFDTVLDSVLKNRAPPRPTAPPDPQAKPTQQASAPQRQTAPTISEQLARSEMDAVREKVRPCWNFPAGAPNPERLVVDIQVSMNPNGTVREASIVDRSRMNDPFYRSAAEAALRATLNPSCQPFPLPPHKYNLWRVFIFSFDPRDL